MQKCHFADSAQNRFQVSATKMTETNKPIYDHYSTATWVRCYQAIAKGQRDGPCQGENCVKLILGHLITENSAFVIIVCKTGSHCKRN